MGAASRGPGAHSPFPVRLPVCSATISWVFEGESPDEPVGITGVGTACGGR